MTGKAKGRTAALQSMQVETEDGSVDLERSASGHWEVRPRPTASELAALYGESYYTDDKPRYFEKTERELPYWRAVWDFRRARIERALQREVVGRRRILDVGCGGGFLLDTFRAAGWEPLGVEPSGVAVDFARERFGLDVHAGGLEELELDAPVDAVHCSLVLEHVLEPLAFMQRVRDLLAPGGVAFVESPNDFNALQAVIRERLDKPAWWVVPRHHLNYFDHDSLAALLGAAGLVEVERLGTFPMELFPLMGRDYVDDASVGAACHTERMQFERSLLETGATDTLAAFQGALAAAGLGRTTCIVARKPQGAVTTSRESGR